MSPKTILCPLDFSSSSEDVLRHASSLANQYGSKLLIIHVSEPPDLYADGLAAYGAYPDTVEDDLRELKKMVPADENIQYEHHHLVGRPDSEIVGFAKEHAVDLIIMGTHGRTGLSHLLLGSIAEHVVRKATCPVLTFRQIDHAIHEADQT